MGTAIGTASMENRSPGPRVRRALWSIVVLLVLSFAMPAIGGVNQAASTTLFALFFLFALGKAFRHIRRREIALHREWMIRAFSIGLAVATTRPIIGGFFATSRFSGLTPYEC